MGTNIAPSPFQVAFEDDIILPKMGYVSSLTAILKPVRPHSPKNSHSILLKKE